MTLFRPSFVVLGLVAVMGSQATTRADDAKAPIEAKAAFETLKSLTGEWNAVTDGHGESLGKVIFRVTANGTAVMETQFPGTDHEMVSVYHLDGDDLRMTHYCAIGNQPRMKLDRKASKPGELNFAFDGGTNLDPAKDMHIHSLIMKIRDDKHVDSAWDAFKDGKPAGVSTFVMSR
jgi:hypothetical protein